MSVSGHDVYDTLEYRAATQIGRLIPTGLFLVFVSLLVYILADIGISPGQAWFWTALFSIVGIGVIAVALWSRFNPGMPYFTLSPEGIHCRIPWCTDFLVPWSEIKAVETATVVSRDPFWLWFLLSSPAGTYRHTAIFQNVTAVRLSKRFYDERIFVDSYVRRGPGWAAMFIPDGQHIQMAIHPELLSVDPQALNQAVTARWQAFGSKTPPSAPSPTRAQSHGNVLRMGDDPRSVTTWETIKIAVPLIGIAVLLANIAGVWELPGQSKDREIARAARASRTAQQEQVKRRKEESKKLEAEQKALQKSIEDTLTRTFGR